MQEIELKLQIPAQALQAVQDEIAGLQAAGNAPLRLRAAYFDTPERALAHAHSALRVRQEGRKWVQTLKSGGSNTMIRVEDNQVVKAPKGQQTVNTDLSRHLGSPAEAVLRTALNWSPESDPTGAQTGLIELYRTDITRHHARMTVGHGTVYEGEVELALDLGHIQAGSLNVAVRELEIESVSGHPMAVIIASRDWSLRHGLWIDTQTKAHRGDRLARQAANHEDTPTSQQATLARPARMKPDFTVDQAWRAGLESVLEHITDNMSELATAPSELDLTAYQWRLGLRRLHALSKLVGRTPVPFPHHALTASRKLYADLGQWRDSHVLQGLPAKIVKHGGPDLPLPTPGSSALRNHGAIVHLARSHLATSLCLDLLAALLSPADSTPEAQQPFKKWLKKRMRAWQQRCQRDAKIAKKLSDETLHQLRKRTKRIRLMASLFADVWKPKRQAQHEAALKAALKVMGKLQDEDTALTWYREAAVHDARAQWVQAWLQGRKRQWRRKTHQALHQWRQTKSPW